MVDHRTSGTPQDPIKAAKATWYVSFPLKDSDTGHQRAPRQTHTFANEPDAKAFARTLLERTDDISAGTINPHTPRRVIAPAAIAAWVNGS